MTILMGIIVLLYATIKFSHLVYKKNPIITQNEVVFDSNFETPVSLNSIGFKAAFAFETAFYDEKLLESPEFVKNIVRQITVKDYVRTEKIIPFHKCTESDYDEFYPIVASQVGTLDARKNKHGMWCLDWIDEDPFVIFGLQSDPDYARLDFKLTSCNEISTTKEASISPVCNSNRT